jgi:pimeloyl-ACP methyl ester carboxylesterase
LQTATTVDGQVEELKTVLGDNSNQSFVLIGHSWGAWLAYLLAARYPALVSHLILVSSGPFEKEYAKQIEPTRLSRITSEEKPEFYDILKALGNPQTPDKDKKLQRLGEIAGKTDHFDPILIDTEASDLIPVQGDTFQSVWNEAAQLRENGILLEMGKLIQCPVLAIHGDYDPHPAEGVKKPLEKILKNFRFILLKDCGHDPWKERQARAEFYQILHHELTQSIH